MNRRLARKRAIWDGAKRPDPVLVPGLYDQTGSLCLATGLFRPRLLMDPRLLGEHRVLKEFCWWHESAHLALGHTRLLAMAKWLGIAFVAALLGTVGALSTRSPAVAYAAMAVGAWVEARLGLATLWLRAKCEEEADQVAASVMVPHLFAAAVKTMNAVQPPGRGYDRWEHGVLYGTSWVERLSRSGLAPVGEAP